MNPVTRLDAMPLRRKIIAIIVAASVLVSIIAAAAYLAYALHTTRENVASSSVLIARTVAGYSAADLAFRDSSAARLTLSGLIAVPHVVNAFLYDESGRLFASLNPAPAAPPLPSTVPPASFTYLDDHLRVVEPVGYGDRRYGTLVLLISRAALHSGLRDGLLVLGALLVFSVVLALLLAMRLQARVSQPVLALADAARRVSRDNDYAVRVTPTTRDEVGELATAFNTMLERIARNEAALRAANRALRAVVECSTAVIHATRENDLLAEVCRLIVERAGYRFAWVGWKEQDPQCTVRPVAHFGYDGGYLDTARISWGDNPHGRGPTGIAIRTGQPSVARHIDTDPGYAPWRAAALQRGYASSLSIPLRTGELTIGALNIYAEAPDAFDAWEMDLLTRLAEDLSFGIAVIRTRRERDEALARLTQRSAEFESMFNAIPDAVMFADLDRRIVMNNPAVHAMFGYSDEELIGHTTEILYADPHEYAAQGRARYRRGPGTSYAPYEVQYRRKDGSVFWTESLGAQVKDARGNHIGFIGIFRDITERKRAEQTILQLNAELEHRVQQRTAELEAANRELETFSYSVSHDLRAPLRSIDGFARLLDEDFGAHMDATARGYLQRVRKSAQRMSALIDDLLNLARVARAELRRERVDLSQLAHDLIAELERSDPDRKVTVTIEPDLMADGDPTLLRIALANLFSNAWKYTRHTAAPRIDFGATTQDGTRCYHVSDNGAGFDMRYADKLFAPFQRLHSAADFEGTGVGLATVARIVSRHGGRIWAQAEPQRGATFYFTLGSAATYNATPIPENPP